MLILACRNLRAHINTTETKQKHSTNVMRYESSMLTFYNKNGVFVYVAGQNEIQVKMILT